ncbi:hypothetical protein WAI453_005744 [Rhynchosporium graminicola]
MYLQMTSSSSCYGRWRTFYNTQIKTSEPTLLTHTSHDPINNTRRTANRRNQPSHVSLSQAIKPRGTNAKS